MKMKLDSEKEWGYYVDAETFHISNIKDDIPDGSLVIIKEKEYIEDISRTVIQTIYGIVSKDEFRPLNKKDISSLMSEACARYILTSDTFPPKVKIEKDLKEDKPAQLAFILSNYDTFHLKISSKLLEGKNPYELISEIVKHDIDKMTLKDKEEIWLIEYAKSSRSKCRSCSSKIEKDTVRVGEPYYYEDHLNYKWHHEKCVFWKTIDKNQVTGIDELEEDDRERIIDYFK